MTQATISAIVPAYNEAARIEAVLEAVIGHPLIAEVIVVDDGSSDQTSAVVARLEGVRLITLPENRGKTWAVTVGIEAAKGSHLLLVDADLLGLSEQDLTALILPVTQGKADLSISLRQNAPRLWHWIGIDYISGERVMPRELLLGRIAEMRRLPRFGLEVYMNSLLIADRARVAVVGWPGVQSPFKNAKFGLWAGIWADVKMLRDMMRAVPVWGLAAQIIRMRRQRVTA